MKKLLSIATAFIIAMIAIGCSKTIEQQITEQLELGQRYLAELNYEEAIVAFQKVIELDPKNSDAYIRIAEAYIGQDDGDQAVAYLEQGLVEIGEENVSWEYIEFLIETYRPIARKCEEDGDIEEAEMYYDKILELNSYDDDASERESVLVNRRKFNEYYEDIVDIAKQLIGDNPSDIGSSSLVSEEFEEFVYGIEQPIICEADNGYYIGVYPGWYIYYGEMKDGVREGYGHWFNVYQSLDLDQSYYLFSGIWHNDYPNGEGKAVIVDSLNSITDYTKEVDTGNCVDGYFDGPFVVVETFGGEDHTWDMILHDGNPEAPAEIAGNDWVDNWWIYSREGHWQKNVLRDSRYRVSGATKE